MPKTLMLMAAGALTLGLIAAVLKPHEGAHASLAPFPVAYAAPSSFPAAPAVAAATPAFPQAASVKAASAEPSPIKATAAKIAEAPAPAKTAPAKKPAVRAPVRISIPSIALNDKVVPVGVNSLGDMDVPSGSTDDIGWYAKGTVPGDIGSAVMDAHVFAALARLDEVKKGDTINVSMADGSTRRFVVTRTQVYKVGDLSPAELFSAKGGRYLHLITCAGALTPDRTSYTHRLVVYATLVK
jgi:LPXTG-site transpeptidase (sortase) family protein